MLFGEHAVLHGHPALAVAVSARLRIDVSPLADRVRIESAVLSAPWEGGRDLAGLSDRLAMLAPALRQASARTGFAMRFTGDLDANWGLGSSSAACLLTVAATARLLGEEIELGSVIARAIALQRAFQGRASGYDVATQAAGGVVRYVRDGGGERVASGGGLPLLVGFTGGKGSTAGLIADVAARFSPDAAEFAAVGALADRAADALRAGDLPALGALLNAGHEAMVALGTVPPAIDATLRALQADPDVLGARLCGAGGGDCVAVLADDANFAARAMRSHGLVVLPVCPEERGLHEESP
jgi:mevalonate kinase